MNASARSRTAPTAHPGPAQRRGRVRGSARRTLPALLAALLPLSACGIPQTGVVEAGEPATGVLEPAPSVAPRDTETPGAAAGPVTVYFVADGSLVAVRRSVLGSSGPWTAVTMVFAGPDAEERRRGLATELPAISAPPTVHTDGATVTVGLPEQAAELSDTAVDQLACTAAASRLHQDPDLTVVQVAVKQRGGRLAGRSSTGCPDPGTSRPAPTSVPR
ncbi:hypothetical protein ACFZAV_40625 [Streptomyces sp. NPDC008343]|uniref:hypothetical protein n=1 Tax=Streptomyces sp. NPDC008343 TaxID=3364828 RepID=UPI0036E08E16